METKEEKEAFLPGEQLSLEELLVHPFCLWLVRERHLALTPVYRGEGRSILYGLKCEMPVSDIIFVLTSRRELYLIDFERRGERRGLGSPLKDMRRFLAWGARAEFPIDGGVAKVKCQTGEGVLPQRRLLEAYQRLYHGKILGYDEHGYPWIGCSARDYWREIGWKYAEEGEKPDSGRTQV